MLCPLLHLFPCSFIYLLIWLFLFMYLFTHLVRVLFAFYLLFIFLLIFLINYYPKTTTLANLTRANLPTAGTRSPTMASRDNFYLSRSHRCQTSMQLVKKVSSWRKNTTGILYCQRNLSTTVKFRGAENSHRSLLTYDTV